MSVEIDLTIRPIGVLQRLSLRLLAFARLADHPDEIYTNLGNDYLQEIERGFATEHNPYLEAWPKSRAAQAEGRATLTDTRRLRESWTARQSFGKLILANATPYAGAHQQGNPRKNLPRRAMVPYRSRGLPQHWRAAMEARVDQAYLRIWNRTR